MVLPDHERAALLESIAALSGWDADFAVQDLGASEDPDRIALAIEICLGATPLDEAAQVSSATGLVEGRSHTITPLLEAWANATGGAAHALANVLGEIAFEMRPQPDPRLAAAATLRLAQGDGGPHEGAEPALHVLREVSRSAPLPDAEPYARAYFEAVARTNDPDADGLSAALGILLDLHGRRFVDELGERIADLPTGHVLREHVEAFVDEAFRLGVR